MSGWTESREAALRSAAPLDFEKASELAADWGISPRSVVSKAVSLGVEYVKKTTIKKRTTRKADVIAAIEAATHSSVEGLGLDKANTSGLMWILALARRVADLETAQSDDS